MVLCTRADTASSSDSSESSEEDAEPEAAAHALDHELAVLSHVVEVLLAEAVAAGLAAAAAAVVEALALVEGQVVEVQVPAGKGKDISGTIRAERAGDKVSVSVASGSVGLASVALFTRGRVERRNVEKGQSQAELHL